MNPLQLKQPPRNLLRDLSRRLFYKAPGEWTADAAEAMHFPDVQQVITLCDLQGIRDAEIVEHFSEDDSGPHASPGNLGRSRAR